MLSHADKSKELYSSSQLLSDQDAFERRIQTEQAGMTEMGKLFVTMQSPSHHVPHALCQLSALGDAVFLSNISLCVFSSLRSPVRF